LDLLASNGGRIVTRRELQEAIWGHETLVDFEAGLATCISQIRTALGDRAVAPRFIETLPRRGYRFVAPVETVATTIVDEMPAIPVRAPVSRTPARNERADAQTHSESKDPQTPTRARRQPWRWLAAGGAIVTVAVVAWTIGRIDRSSVSSLAAP